MGKQASALMRGNCRKKNILDLQKQLRVKETQLRQAQLEHSRFAFKHQLLMACVDSLGSILQHGRWQQQQQEQQLLLALSDSPEEQQQQQPEEQPEQMSCIAADPDLVSAAEQLLLDQLAQVPYNSQLQPSLAAALGGLGSSSELDVVTASSSSSSSSIVTPQQDTVAPAGDPFYGLRWLLTQPLLPGAAAITLQQALAYYAQTVRELSLCLHLHCIAPSHQEQQQQDQQTPMMKMKAIIFRYLRFLASMLILRRLDINTGLCIRNHDTGELGSDSSIMDRHRLAVRQLNLSPQQQHLILQGSAVFSELAVPLEEECRQLQQQLGVELAPEASARTLLQHLTSSNQKEKADRLLMLLRKTSLLRIIMASIVWGALTFTQLAQVMVFMSPYAANPASFVAATKELYEQQKQQQLEERGQAWQQQQQQLNGSCSKD